MYAGYGFPIQAGSNKLLFIGLIAGGSIGNCILAARVGSINSMEGVIVIISGITTIDFQLIDDLLPAEFVFYDVSINKKRNSIGCCAQRIRATGDLRRKVVVKQVVDIGFHADRVTGSRVHTLISCGTIPGCKGFKHLPGVMPLWYPV